MSEARSGGSSTNSTAYMLDQLKEALTFEETRVSVESYFRDVSRSPENFNFLARCHYVADRIADDKSLTNLEKHNALRSIFDSFFSTMSKPNQSGAGTGFSMSFPAIGATMTNVKYDINVSHATTQLLKAEWEEVQKQPLERRDYAPLYSLLDKAVDEVLRLVARDSFKRYLETKPTPQRQSVLKRLFKGAKEIVRDSNPRPMILRWPASFVHRELATRFEDQRAAKEKRDLQKNQEAQRPLGGSEMKFNPDERASSELAARLARELELSDDDSPKHSRENSGAMHAVFGSGSSSSSSSSTDHQVQYGNTLAFQGSCQAFLDGTTPDEKKAALTDIIRHIEQNKSLFGDLAVLENLRLTLRMWSDGAVLVERKLNQLEKLVAEMQVSGGSSSSSSSTSSRSVGSASSDQVRYGDRVKYLACCQSFLDEKDIGAKMLKLAEILLHMDPKVAQFSFTPDYQTTLQTRLAVWEGGVAPTTHQIDEMQGFVEQLQYMAL